MSDDIVFMPLAEVAGKIASGALTSAQVTRVMLDRIEAKDPELNTYITVCGESAMETAEALDKMQAAGTRLSPMHGVPIALKDNIETEGIRTTGASALFADNIPEADATVAKRLKGAGTVMLGKLGLYELAFGRVHPDFGESRNPFDPDKACGASSSGPAAAVAAGMAYASLGTDTGGSIRLPAAACGLVGLKPTYGVISRAGVLPAGYSLDHVGPLTRTVQDGSLMMAAMVGPDARDPAGSQNLAMDWTRPAADLAGIRIGVPVRQDSELIGAEMQAAFDHALETLKAAGAELVPVTCPDHLHSRALMWAISSVELAEAHRDYLREQPEKYTDGMRTNILQGALLPATEYVHAQRARQAIAAAYAEIMTGVEVIAMPVVPMPAWTIGAETVTIGNEVEGLMPALTRYCPPFNMTGQPAVALPLGVDAGGLPLSFQLAGRMHDDARLMQIAAAFEKAADWAQIDFASARMA